MNQTSFIPTTSLVRRSAFDKLGFQKTVDALLEEIRELYCADNVPIVIGFSGGKDSSCTLQLFWMALRGLPIEKRTKPVHVISTNTLVENPIVVQWTDGSLAAMRDAAKNDGLPIETHRLMPNLDDSFWVCLIGKGYAAPRHLYRWCTERLKIRPSNAFIEQITSESNGSLLVLGTRKAESAERAKRMKKLEAGRVRDKVSPNVALPGSFVYSPIEDWTNDDVWMFLMQIQNPWGWSNKGLMSLYRSASEDNECPVVVDTSTPSCGNSRFGCWTCTMVEQDKSLTAMASNEVEFEWMLPLVALRNELDIENDRHLRDFRRLNGRVDFMRDGTTVIPGPYLRSAREHWLRRVLNTQRIVRSMAPPAMKNIELISIDELQRIRRIWVLEKYELEDTLPSLYLSAAGTQFPDVATLVQLPVDLSLLRGACATEHDYELCRSLVGVLRIHGDEVDLPKRVGAVFDRYAFETETQALATSDRTQPGLFDARASEDANFASLRAKRVATATEILRGIKWLGSEEELPDGGTVVKKGRGKKRGKVGVKRQLK